jgi:hypothetical protein
MSIVRPFPLDTRLTGIALAYMNKALIADSVLPRVPVGGQTFKWLAHTRADRFTVPATRIGRKGRPQEIEFSTAEQPGQVFDYGLDDVVPNDDIAAAPQGFDPLGNATEILTDLILLDREKRTADLVFNPATYPAGNKVTNSAGTYWDVEANNPVAQITDLLNGMLVRPNVAVFSRKVYDALRRHPKVIAAVFPLGGNAAQSGMANRQQLAELFELEEVLVGEGFINTAKPGQAATMARVWANHAAFIHRNRLANTRSPQMTFGYTAQWQGRVAGQMSEPQTGLRGAVRVRTGESVNEIVCAADAGYLVENAITP